MRIIDEPLLAEFAESRVCGWCRRPLRYRPHVHHVFSRGAGRLDVRVNLIPLGGPWDCNDHGRVHAGEIQRCDLLAVVAAREGCNQVDIEAAIWALRQLPKQTELRVVGETLARFGIREAA